MRVAWWVGITTGWGETEVFMEVSSRRLAIVQHRHLPARGLLSLISLLSAFLLTGIKRNQVVVYLPEVACSGVYLASAGSAGGLSPEAGGSIWPGGVYLQQCRIQPLAGLTQVY